jgi:FAS-associated factor 2
MADSTPDISDLTDAQSEALQTYTSVTDSDPIAAIPILQRAEWNTQIAIARFFDGEPTTDPVAEARAALPAPSSRQTTNLAYESLLAGSTPRPPRRYPADSVERVDIDANNETRYQSPSLLSVIFTPFRILYRIFSTLFSPFSFLLPGFVPRLFARLTTPPSRPTRRTLAPADNARRFLREFEEQYGDNTLPFVESGFNLALDNAKKDLKFLIVVLLSPSHDDNDSWIRETLLSPSLKNFFASHTSDTILWGGNVQDSEAYQVSTSLKCTKFPFVALICRTTDTSPPPMTTVLRAAGPTPASELVAKLATAITTQETQLAASRAQLAEQSAAQSLRREQDSAYERSLAQDRERTRLRREEQEAQARAEKEVLMREQAAETQAANLKQWRRWRAQSLPAEPPAELKDAIRVSIRLSSGERLIRRFGGDADLEELYAFVECQEFLEDENEKAADVDEPAGYTHAYGFQLVSPMPRTIYGLDEGGSVGDRVGRGANLIVEPLDVDGSDTEDV